MIYPECATFREKSIIRKVEKALYFHLGQDNFFAVDLDVSDEETIRRFNREQRNVDSVTDVLSFPYITGMRLPALKDEFPDEAFDGKFVLLGAVMICRPRAQSQADEYGHSYDREFGFLFCHGMLHLLGFDHEEPEDEKIMLAHQKAVMELVKLGR